MSICDMLKETRTASVMSDESFLSRLSCYHCVALEVEGVVVWVLKL